MNKLKTHAIKQVKLLYAILGTSKTELENVILNKQSYYYTFTKIKKDKRGRIIYENGLPKTRQINATNGRLNEFQSIIFKGILSNVFLPKYIKGGVKGESNITNARVHLGKRFKLKTDLKKYFPSINSERVRKMYLNNGFSSKVAELLTQITTNNNELPQGTPCSTIIANLAFIPIDNVLVNYCIEKKITYSRFVDDMVFSSQSDFKDNIKDIIKIIISSGFRISVKKTIYSKGSLDITGVLVKQNILDANNELKELIEDTSINLETTLARIRYIDQIKLQSKVTKKPVRKKNNVEFLNLS